VLQKPLPFIEIPLCNDRNRVRFISQKFESKRHIGATDHAAGAAAILAV
jgi:hypothetical protein